MDLIDKLREFVLSYPGWEAGKLLFLDYTDATPGNGGLFPEGITQVSFREDILGNRQADMRLQVFFYRCGGEEEGDAAWLLDFQNWVAEQSALGKTPQLGDIPQREQLRAEKGKLSKIRGEGKLYSVVLTAEFTKTYEVNENGEN